MKISLLNFSYTLTLLLIIGQLNLLYGQSERLVVDVASVNIENYLGKSNFVTDTIKELDGYIYFFNLTDDSGYVRVNALTNSEFDCCNGLDYKVKSKFDSNSDYSQCVALDHGGPILDYKLFWRRMIIGDFEIVYNMIPETMLLSMDNIFTSIKLELNETCKGSR